jgi:hypothetical protein
LDGDGTPLFVHYRSPHHFAVLDADVDAACTFRRLPRLHGHSSRIYRCPALRTCDSVHQIPGFAVGPGIDRHGRRRNGSAGADDCQIGVIGTAHEMRGHRYILVRKNHLQLTCFAGRANSPVTQAGGSWYE